MRKFMNVSAITAGIMIFLGIGLFTVGGCGGGISETVQKIVNGDFNFTDEDLKNIIGNYVSSGDDGLTITDGNDNSKYLEDFPVITDRETYECDFDPSEFDSLFLQLGGCEVQMTASEDEKVHIRAEKVKKMQTGVEDNTLNITVTNKNGIAAGSWTKVEIRVPADKSWKKCAVDLGAGDFSIESLTVKNVTIDIGAGRLQIEKLVCSEDAKCEIGAGQMLLNDVQIGGSFAGDIGAGEMRLTGNIQGNAEVSCAMGNTEMTFIGSTMEEHNYEVSCSAGNIDIGNRSFAGLATESDIDNGAANTYKLECAMGNITVKFQ